MSGLYHHFACCVVRYEAAGPYLEFPDTGDSVRGLSISTKGIGMHPVGLNVSFEQLNRG